MKRNLTQLAAELATQLLEQDRQERTGAAVIAYYKPHDGTPRRVVRVIENAADPYQALQQAGDNFPTDADAILMTCAGWAAPTETNTPPNTPPSLDPHRKRCALVVARTLTRKQPATIAAIQLTGEPEPMTETTGAGPLAEALNNTARTITKRRSR